MPRKSEKKKNQIEEGLENFAEEMGKIGENIEKHFDSHHKKMKHRFGLLSPFLSSLVGILILAMIILLIGYMNQWLSSSFLLNLNNFLFRNIGFFFVTSIFFSYASYVSDNYPKNYQIVAPIVAALGIAFGFWVAGNILSIVNISFGIPVLDTIAYIMTNSVLWILGIVIFIGYIIILVKLIAEIPAEPRSEVHMKKERTKKSNIRRLYRSGEEKILGGVCGGIAEYLNIDPVLIRLIWVAAGLTGTGILLYIIAWIIIPRNPNHKWDD